MSSEAESVDEQPPEPERLRGILRDQALEIVSDFRTAWEVSRPETSEIPFFQELIDGWEAMSDLRNKPPARETDTPIIDWIDRYQVQINMLGHIAYHNLARRRVRFFERERKIFEYFSARVDELREEAGKQS